MLNRSGVFLPSFFRFFQKYLRIREEKTDCLDFLWHRKRESSSLRNQLQIAREAKSAERLVRAEESEHAVLEPCFCRVANFFS